MTVTTNGYRAVADVYSIREEINELPSEAKSPNYQLKRVASACNDTYRSYAADDKYYLPRGVSGIPVWYRRHRSQLT